MGILIAETRQGKLLGAPLTGRFEGITSFRSVPYAAPPVGALRFRAPEEHEPWPGIRDATHFAARPMQNMGFGPDFEPWGTDFYYEGYPVMSEDCLYLNITTGADSPDEKRPVFMWFHGGGLNTGYYSEIEFDPSVLASKGIIVVSVGQRLNVLGYLCTPALFNEQNGTCGNYGLKDELQALKWVRENIAAFGGDPDNITVGGQSGGTAKSTGLVTCPKSAGMIRRCINQSNLAWLRGYVPMEVAFERGRRYLESCGIDPDATPDELRAIPADRFYIGDGSLMPGMMAADGVYVDTVSAAENMRRHGTGVDYLSGGNLGESSVNTPGLFPGKPFETAAEFYGHMKSMLGDLYDAYDFEHLWPVTDENADYMSRVLASRAFSNNFAGPGAGGVLYNRYFGVWRKEHAPGTRNFCYVFSHVVPSRPEEKGTFRDQDHLLAWHSSELWFTFASLREDVPPARPWREIDFELAETISSYWANFIATGDPNGEGLPVWPESNSWGWMDLGDVPTAHDGLDKLDELALAYVRANKLWPDIESL